MTDSHQTPLYLGVDGGGSGCRARLVDARGQLLGEGRAGPANWQLGPQTVREQVLDCIGQALAQAGQAELPLQQLHAGLGLAGLVRGEDFEQAAPLRALFGHGTLASDAYTACLGAHGGEPGAIVVVGTGSCAQVITPQLSQSYGGWGFALSDQASGAWLGHQALREAVAAMEGLAPASALSETLGAPFGHRPGEALRWGQSATPADYAALAPEVFALAEQRDKRAELLVGRACDELGKLILAVEKHNTGRIALLGGLAESYAHHLPKPLTDKLCAPRGDALDGALLLAGLAPSVPAHA